MMMSSRNSNSCSGVSSSAGNMPLDQILLALLLPLFIRLVTPRLNLRATRRQRTGLGPNVKAVLVFECLLSPVTNV